MEIILGPRPLSLKFILCTETVLGLNLRPFPSYVTSGKFLNFSEPQFLHLQNGDIVLPTIRDYCQALLKVQMLNKIALFLLLPCFGKIPLLAFFFFQQVYLMSAHWVLNPVLDSGA